jgi:hypothetical protein
MGAYDSLAFLWFFLWFISLLAVWADDPSAEGLWEWIGNHSPLDVVDRIMGQRGAIG